MGVIGQFGTRTPMALATALPIAAAVLIVGGVLGVVATFWKPSAPPAVQADPTDPYPTVSEEDHHEATDPKP